MAVHQMLSVKECGRPAPLFLSQKRISLSSVDREGLEVKLLIGTLGVNCDLSLVIWVPVYRRATLGLVVGNLANIHLYILKLGKGKKTSAFSHANDSYFLTCIRYDVYLV